MAVIDLILAAWGQSNMVGNDSGSGFTTPYYTQRLWDSVNSWWNLYTESKASCLPNLCKEIIDKYQVASIGCIQSAVSGKGVVNNWSDENDAVYINAKNDLVAAIAANPKSKKIIVYFGGENDIFNGYSGSTFKTAFRLMQSNIWGDTGDSSIVFYVIKPWATDYPTESAVISTAYDELEAAGDIVILCDAYDYQGYLMPDDQHYTRAGQDLIGTESGDNLKDLITINPEYDMAYQTIGPGGGYDYLLLSSALTSIGAPTEDLILDVKETITEPTNYTYAPSLGNYSITVKKSNGAKIISSEATNNLFEWKQEGPGKLILDGLHWEQSVDRGSVLHGFFRISSVVTAFNLEIKDNIFDMNGKVGCCWRCSTATPIIETYGNIYKNGDYGIILDASDGNANNIYENDTVYNMSAVGFAVANNPGKVRNLAVYGSGTTDLTDTGSLTEYTKTATSDTSGSEAGLQSRTFLTDFVDAVNFIPKRYGTLDGAGVNPVITNHTKYGNQAKIFLGNVDIGANGILRASLIQRRRNL